MLAGSTSCREHQLQISARDKNICSAEVWDSRLRVLQGRATPWVLRSHVPHGALSNRFLILTPSSRFRRRSSPSNLLFRVRRDDLPLWLQRSWLVAGGRAPSGGALSATPPGDAEPSPRKPEEPRLGGLRFLINSVCRFLSVYFG